MKIQPPHKPSPFSCFAYDNYWVGRDKLVADLSVKVLGDYRVLMLLGLTGIGKTALAEKLAVDLEDWLEGDWKNRFRRANFDYSDKATDFVTVATRWLEEWGEKLTPEESKPEWLLTRLVKRLSENRTLVLIDSLERLLAKLEQFISLCLHEGLNDYLQLILDIGLATDPELIWQKILEVKQMKYQIREETWPMIDQFFREMPEAIGKLPTFQEALASTQRQGALTNEHRLVIRQLRRKFQQIPAVFVQQIEATDDMEQLDNWLDQIMSANQLADIDFKIPDKK